MTPWKIGAAWLAVLAATTLLTWQIVSFADSRVSATPVEVAPRASTAPESSTITSIGITTTTRPTTTTSSASPSTTVPGSGSGSGTTSSTPFTPTTAPAAWSVRTITSSGGIVVVRYRPDEIELQAATPAPGFTVEIDDAGPARVRVEFESDESDIRVEAEWKGTGLDVEISGN